MVSGDMLWHQTAHPPQQVAAVPPIGGPAMTQLPSQTLEPMQAASHPSVVQQLTDAAVLCILVKDALHCGILSQVLESIARS